MSEVVEWDPWLPRVLYAKLLQRNTISLLIRQQIILAMAQVLELHPPSNQFRQLDHISLHLDEQRQSSVINILSSTGPPAWTEKCNV